jgi:hypothetical protein
MDNIIKSFSFECENIKLVLNIKKEVLKDSIKMFIDANVTNNNLDITEHKSENGTSKNLCLKFKNENIFWISYNKRKGLRWKSYKNETGFTVYNTLKEMKEQYIEQREFIPQIAEYFYSSIKRFKKIKLLYDLQIEEIIEED